MKDNKTYLQHIFQAIEKIEKYLTGVSYETFQANDMMFDAVIHEIQIIGEAANSIDKAFQDQHPEIPWIRVIGMRNYLVHEYFGVISKIVWDTAQDNLGELKKAIMILLH